MPYGRVVWLTVKRICRLFHAQILYTVTNDEKFSFLLRHTHVRFSWFCQTNMSIDLFSTKQSFQQRFLTSCTFLKRCFMWICVEIKIEHYISTSLLPWTRKVYTIFYEVTEKTPSISLSKASTSMGGTFCCEHTLFSILWNYVNKTGDSVCYFQQGFFYVIEKCKYR